MKPTRRRSAAAVAAAAMVIATAVIAPSAQASGSKCNPGCEASVDFRSYGERFIVHDNERDGHSAVGEFQVLIGGDWLGLNQAVFWNSNRFVGPPEVFNLSVRDGTPVRYRACVGERAERTFFDCSRNWRRDEA
jgi:hypothetical protein